MGGNAFEDCGTWTTDTTGIGELTSQSLRQNIEYPFFVFTGLFGVCQRSVRSLSSKNDKAEFDTGIQPPWKEPVSHRGVLEVSTAYT